MKISFKVIVCIVAVFLLASTILIGCAQKSGVKQTEPAPNTYEIPPNEEPPPNTLEPTPSGEEPGPNIVEPAPSGD